MEAKIDWFPWYFTLYEQDTMHLNPYQDGCYRRLIDHYMKTRAPLPDNDHALSRIIGDSFENWMNASGIVRAFFKPKNGNLYHKFCDKILDEQDSRSKSRSKSAKIAAEKRWKKDEINQEVKCETHATGMRDACETHQENDLLHATGQDRTIQDSNRIDLDLKDRLPKNKKSKIEELLEIPPFIKKENWVDYLEMREKIKKPATARAKAIAINKLRVFHEQGHDVNAIIEQSILSNWQDFYLPKNNQNGSAKLSQSMLNLKDIHENGW